MNGSHDMRQKRKRAEMKMQRRGYFLPGLSMNSEVELPLDLEKMRIFNFINTNVNVCKILIGRLIVAILQ